MKYVHTEESDIQECIQYILSHIIPIIYILHHTNRRKEYGNWYVNVLDIIDMKVSVDIKSEAFWILNSITILLM